MVIQVSDKQKKDLQAWWLVDMKNPQGDVLANHLLEGEKLISDLKLRDVTHLRAVALALVAATLKRL